MRMLSQREIRQRLGALQGWRLTAKGIRKKYELKDFRVAMAFVNRVADLAEQVCHHPDIFVQYGTVTFTLITHDAGGLTDKDFELAARIEAILHA
jgi:4a-hydroxytetrahydrobiopterin dehydratase